MCDTVCYRNGGGGGLRGFLKVAQIVKFSTLEGPWSLFLQTGHFFLTVLSCVDCGGLIVPLNWPERAPSRIYIIRISLVAKFVFVPLAPCSMGCFLGRFWGPLGQVWGHPASPNWFKIFDLDLPQPVPPSFHAVPTVWDHQSLQIAILADLGCFWAVLGPGDPKFDKFCVREVERGPEHLESSEKCAR